MPVTKVAARGPSCTREPPATPAVDHRLIAEGVTRDGLDLVEVLTRHIDALQRVFTHTPMIVGRA